jgi:hypothetical protein
MTVNEIYVFDCIFDDAFGDKITHPGGIFFLTNVFFFVTSLLSGDIVR